MSSRKRASWSPVRWGAVVLGALLLTLVVLLYWLVSTASGARAVFSLVAELTGQELQTEVSGALLGGLVLTDTSYHFPGGSLTSARIELETPRDALFAGTVEGVRLKARDLRIELEEATDQPGDTGSGGLPESLAAPVHLAVDLLDLHNVQIVRGNTSITLARITAALQWEDTRLNVDSLVVEHAYGRFETAGQMDLQGEYSFDFYSNISLQHTEIKEISALLNTNGNLSSGFETVAILAAPYSSEVRMVITDPLQDPSLRANVSLAPESMGTLYPAGPVELRSARVGGTLQVNIASLTEPLTASINDVVIDGEWLGAALSLRTAMTLREESLELKATTLNWSGITTTLEGSLGPVSDFSARFTVQALSALTHALATLGVDLGPQALTGSLLGEVSVTGSLDSPKVQASLGGAQIGLGDMPVLDVSFNIGGTREQHRYDLTVTGEHYLRSSGQGVLLADDRWQFLFDSLVFGTTATPEEVAFSAVENVRGSLQPATAALSLEPFCLQQLKPAGAATVCSVLRSMTGQDNRPAIDVTLNDFDLAALNVLLGGDQQISGTVNGVLNWTGKAGTSLLNLRLDGLGLKASIAGESQEVLRFAPAALRLAGEGESAVLGIDLPLLDLAGKPTGGLVGNVSITGLDGADPLAASLSGEVRLTLDELARVPGLASVLASEQISGVDGTVRAAVNITGTVGQPDLQGEANLALADLLLEAQGIELADSTLNVAFLGDSLTFEGSVRPQPLGSPAQRQGSSANELSVVGRVDWTSELLLEAVVSGESVLALDRPDALVRVSPELRLGYAAEAIRVRGNVVVPEAQLRVESAPVGVVRATTDQIILGEEFDSAGPAIDAAVRVRLGDTVSFSGMGLDARFAGEVSVTQRPEALPTAVGEILITQGSYTAYGQDLNVTDGRLVFVGGPLDEPGIDLRATRQATPDVEVGVHAIGALAAPEFSTFSTPALPQSDQLSYLVLGRPMTANSAAESSLMLQAAMALGVKGGELLTDRLGDSLGLDTFAIESAPGTGSAQAALVIGKYLSPRLYVSYGYGLFEPVSTLRFDYQLSPLWRIVTESSNAATGGDINFVKER